jgi:hypothetical protein
MSKSRKKQNTRGPMSYRNWLSALQNKPLQWTVEFPLYSDVERIVGGFFGCGPYQLLNTGSFYFSKEAPLRPVLVLRMDDHEIFSEVGDMDHTETQSYHGGSLCDEIAALISLCLGIRLKAGALSRRFDPKGDPKGKPQYIEFQEVPLFSKNWRGRILPYATGERSIQEIPLLCQLPELLPLDAATLIRSARMYQEAIWVAEAQPETAWLLLVSSVEVAANEHFKGEQIPLETIVEMMQTTEPELVDVLQRREDAELVAEVAQVMKKKLASTRNFRDFIIEFCPPPPERRPLDTLQTVWLDNEVSFRKALSLIYSHRSKALHEGIPFPWPMCEIPYLSDGIFSEIPTGGATQGMGGTWVHKDTPMLLHIFEYIVRNALLKWWESMLTSTPPG